MPSLAAVNALQGRKIIAGEVFNTITSEDWKRSIALGRSRKNQVSEQIHAKIMGGRTDYVSTAEGPESTRHEFSKQKDVSSQSGLRL